MTERVHELQAIGIDLGQRSVIDLAREVELDRVRAELAALKSRPKRVRGPSPFTQSDVTRVVKGVQAGGASVGKMEITKDTITVEIGKAADDAGALDASVVALHRIAALRRVK